jgi:hypothetical protein
VGRSDCASRKLRSSQGGIPLAREDITQTLTDAELLATVKKQIHFVNLDAICAPRLASMKTLKLSGPWKRSSAAAIRHKRLIAQCAVR